MKVDTGLKDVELIRDQSDFLFQTVEDVHPQRQSLLTQRSSTSASLQPSTNGDAKSSRRQYKSTVEKPISSRSMGVLTTDPIHTRTNFDCTSLSSKTVKYFNSYTIKNNPVLIQRLSNLNSKNKKAQSLDQLVPTSATNSEINQLVIVGESVFKKEKKYVFKCLTKQRIF